VCGRADLRVRAHRRARHRSADRRDHRAPHHRRTFTIHISGCAKGCAHPASAALTVVGTPGRMRTDRQRLARAIRRLPLCGDELPAAIARYAWPRTGSARPIMSERAAYLRDGTAIYERSFAIIRAEADLSRFSPEEADVAVRMIHACGLVEAAQHIVFGQNLVARRAARSPPARRSCATPRWWRMASRGRGCRRATR
jgi:hypothetical protein